MVCQFEVNMRKLLAELLSQGILVVKVTDADPMLHDGAVDVPGHFHIGVGDVEYSLVHVNAQGLFQFHGAKRTAAAIVKQYKKEYRKLYN